MPEKQNQEKYFDQQPPFQCSLVNVNRKFLGRFEHFMGIPENEILASNLPSPFGSGSGER